MNRFWLLSLVGVSACAALTPEPQIITRVDTVEVVREVAPPLPAGDTVLICLSNGRSVEVLVSETGDTLIGDARINLRSVRPVLGFAGNYAQPEPDTVRFEKRLYRRAGVAMKRDCDELKNVGDVGGIPVFAEVTAPQSLPAILLPVRPGVFQNYMTTAPARRR